MDGGWILIYEIIKGSVWNTKTENTNLDII